jgi:O-antigen ligase
MSEPRHVELFRCTSWPARRTCSCLLILALCAVPASIAITEILLGLSLLFRLESLKQHRPKVQFPRVFWFWLAWAALELLSWLHSPEPKAGQGEIRHLLLVAALFLLIPSLSLTDRVTAWRGIFFTSSLSSMVLIGTFAWRLHSPPPAIAPVIYLRNGGLVHHWMIYGSVEILVFAALLAFWHAYPEKRRYLMPVLAIAVVASVLSLTRMLWICCLLLWGLHLVWRRSRWIWAIPVVPLALFFLSPGAVRARASDSAHLEYYSNAERLQMLRVGYRMIRAHPLTGVGPGRVHEFYRDYLSPADPVPAYYGHLHNNLVQIAAESGLPVASAAILFVVILFRDLLRQYRAAEDRHQRFLCCTALLGLTGYLAAGMFDYTYGHSLGLILLGFVVFTPLLPQSARRMDELEGQPSEATYELLRVTYHF